MYSAGERPLDQVVLSSDLPVTVQITRKCQLKDKYVLQEGQFVTILELRNVIIIKGTDYEGKEVWINGKKDVLIDVIEELFPKDEHEYKILSSRINVVFLKQKFGFDSVICEAGESFLIQDNSSNNPLSRNITLIRDKDGKEISIPFEVFLNPNIFSYAELKEQVRLNSSLGKLIRKRVYFPSIKDDSTNMNLPRGIVKLNTLISSQVVSTVTIPTSSKYLLYETYKMDKRIMARVCGGLPRHIALLGGAETKPYQEKLEEIAFLTYYDCYAPRFYGHFTEENFHDTEDWNLQREENKGTIFSNPLQVSRNIPIEHVCTLKVKKTLLQKLSKHLLFRKSLGRILSPSPEKKIKAFYQRNQSLVNFQDDVEYGNLDDVNLTETNVEDTIENLSLTRSNVEYTKIPYEGTLPLKQRRYNVNEHYERLVIKSDNEDSYVGLSDKSNHKDSDENISISTKYKDGYEDMSSKIFDKKKDEKLADTTSHQSLNRNSKGVSYENVVPRMSENNNHSRSEDQDSLPYVSGIRESYYEIDNTDHNETISYDKVNPLYDDDYLDSRNPLYDVDNYDKANPLYEGNTSDQSTYQTSKANERPIYESIKVRQPSSIPPLSSIDTPEFYI